MVRRWATVAALLLSASSAVAQGRIGLSVPGKDAAPHTQVLVLGTVHLSNAPKGFRPESLTPLIERLAAYKPQIITVEQIPGEACDMTARHPAIYAPEDMRPYCPDTSKAKAATGLDVPAAIAEIKQTLEHWPAQPTGTQRRHLAALFLAANDDTSALVQWLQLPSVERHAGEGLDDGLVKELDADIAANSENFLIAAPLAARLGLQRVFPVDDHTGDNADVADGAGYGKAIQRAWEGVAAARRPIDEKESSLWKSGQMLALYRYINRPEVQRTSIDSDFGAALGDTSPEHYGQIYVAAWETRNLRMVANVHAAFRERPGARVLSVVGSSHKSWFDSLLGQMQHVDIVDVEQVLK